MISRSTDLTKLKGWFLNMANITKKYQIPHSHRPYGEDGSGYYSQHTVTSYSVNNETEELLLDAACKWKDIKETFCIADYGTADGGTSMPVFRKLIRKLREIHGDDLPIHVNYEDQPVNDFKSLFLRLQGLISGTPSYFLEDKNVYVSACGTGFYSQCFPPNYLHIGLSCTALHWLSGKPCNITEATVHTLSTKESEREAFRRWAAKDWETILLHRAKELKHGGRLIIAQICIDKDGNLAGDSSNIKRNVHKVMSDIWLEMAQDGKITMDEFINTTLNIYFRTIPELRAPFDDPQGSVPKSGLRLVSIETKLVRCPFHTEWLKHGGDPTAHAQRLVAAIRSWSNDTFLSGLSETRTKEEKYTLVDELYERFITLVAKNPADHGLDYVNAYMVIEKE